MSPSEPIRARPAAAETGAAFVSPGPEGSPWRKGANWRILRAISQERDQGMIADPSIRRGASPRPRMNHFLAKRSGVYPLDAGHRGPLSGFWESSNLNLRTRSLLFTATIAATVLVIALLLVVHLVTVSGDPQLAGQIGWNLLFIGFSAGILAAAGAWWVVRRITLPLRKLAETMSAMARSGELQSDFASSGGG